MVVESCDWVWNKGRRELGLDMELGLERGWRGGWRGLGRVGISVQHLG